jgi:hypothetical protein
MSTETVTSGITELKICSTAAFTGYSSGSSFAPVAMN